MLRTLLAADNKFSDFDQILGTLETLRQLHFLTLKGNPIAKKPNYKVKVIGSVYRLGKQPKIFVTSRLICYFFLISVHFLFQRYWMTKR